MLIIIYGEDTYRSREWLHELEKKFREKFDAQGYNSSRSLGTVPLGELRAAITAPPFLGAKRMIAVERLLEKSGKQEDLEEIITRVPESTIVILWEEGDEKTFAKIPLFAKLVRKKETKCYPFNKLRANELESWLRKQAQTLGLTFERGAFEELVTRVGADLWQMNGELEKFAALGKPITKSMVENLVRGVAPENIFGFVDAIADHDAPRAVRELAAERENEATVPYLLTMLARQFRMLREARDYLDSHERATAAELVGVFGWHPFVAKKTLVQARAFNRAELQNYLDAIFYADRNIKIGVMDQDTALDLLVAKLLGQVVSS